MSDDEEVRGQSLDFYCACGAMWEGEIDDDQKTANHVYSILWEEWEHVHMGDGHADVGRDNALNALNAARRKGTT